jgi:hypothetical protein
MKKIAALVVLATSAFLIQIGCKSTDTTNSPSGTSSPPTGSASPGTTIPNSTSDQSGKTQTANNKQTDSVFPELVMQYSQIFTAEMKNDQAKVDSLLASDYKETTGDGRTLNKAQVLAEIKPERKFDTYSLDGLKSTLNGDNGTVTGRASVTREGKTETWQFTTTLKKANGQWLATSTKITDYKKS